MSFILVVLLIIFIVAVAAKMPLKLFLVTGTISAKNGQTLKLVRYTEGQPPELLSSCRVYNNQFRMSCNVDKISPVSIVFEEENERIVYGLTLEEGHQDITIGLIKD